MKIFPFVIKDDYLITKTTCHCTGLPVSNQMKEIMGAQLSYVRSGDEVVVE